MREKEAEKDRDERRETGRDRDRDPETETQTERQTETEQNRERYGDRHRETWRCFSGQEATRRVPRDRGLSRLQGRQIHSDVCPTGGPELVRET